MKHPDQAGTVAPRLLRFARNDIAEQAGHICCRAVSQPDPDHFRQQPIEDAEMLKVFILVTMTSP
jgi:hypothetical protein